MVSLQPNMKRPFAVRESLFGVLSSFLSGHEEAIHCDLVSTERCFAPLSLYIEPIKDKMKLGNHEFSRGTTTDVARTFHFFCFTYIIFTVEVLDKRGGCVAVGRFEYTTSILKRCDVHRLAVD